MFRRSNGAAGTLGARRTPRSLRPPRLPRVERASLAATVRADEWVPVVDISQHPGDVDFGRMRGEGVQGLILRAVHGLDPDDRAERNYELARNAGFASTEIGWYPFLNPKRGSGRQCAEALCSVILRATAGEWVPFTMIDAESHASETPDKGRSVTGQAYARWVREHEATTADILPTTHRIGYTNAAYWNGNVGDPELAATFEWIVPRYPVYSFAGYLAHPLPEPARWHEWAAYWLAGGKGPLPPAGADGWAGWQISAGWNRQGARLGASSRDIDCNIIRADAWRRWTTRPDSTPTPPPVVLPTPTEDDMPPELIRFAGFWDEILETSGGALHGSAEQKLRWRLLYGVTASPNTPPGLVSGGKMALVIDPENQPAKFASVLHQLGLTVADLTPSGEQ